MDVLVPLLNHQANNYKELRYALRSFELHIPDANPILIGGLPNWYKGERLQHRDYYTTAKERNILDKVKFAADTLKLDRFIFANDDHFLLAPVKEPTYFETIQQAIQRKPAHTSYGVSLRNTAKAFGDDIMNFDGHCPMTMETDKLNSLPYEFFVHPHGVVLKTAYIYSNNLQGQGTFYPDAKYKVIPETIDRHWFSTSDVCSNLNGLEQIYPNKSKWEI